MANDNSGGGWLGVLVVIWLVYSGIAAAWHSKARYFVTYALPYGMNYEQVTRENLPHDCDWLKSPLGDKECHYDAKIQTIITGNDRLSGKPIYSDDDGKTWNPNDYGTKPSVYVGWERVEE